MKATLVKTATSDGLFETNSGVPIGREYDVDLASRKVLKFFHVPKQVEHSKECIWVTDDHGFSGWVPVEMLRIPLDA